MVAALGGLLFGFDTAVIAGTTHAMTETFRLSPAALGLDGIGYRRTDRLTYNCSSHLAPPMCNLVRAAA